MSVRIGESDFKKLLKINNKGNHFSPSGITAIYNQMHYWGDDYVIDISTLCEDYTEFENWEAFKKAYKKEAEYLEKKTKTTNFKNLLEELSLYTDVIEIDGGNNFIVESFEKIN